MKPPLLWFATHGEHVKCAWSYTHLMTCRMMGRGAFCARRASRCWATRDACRCARGGSSSDVTDGRTGMHSVCRTSVHNCVYLHCDGLVYIPSVFALGKVARLGAEPTDEKHQGSRRGVVGCASTVESCGY